MGLILFLILVVGISFVISPVMTSITVVIVMVITIWCSCATRKRDKKIVSAEVVNRTRVMTEKCEPSGFSIGSRGGSRAYWRFKQVPSHIEARVEVVYEDGKHRQLNLVEGGSRYNRIMAICENRKQVPLETMPVIAESPKPVIAESPKPVIAESPKSSAPKVDYVDIKTNQLVAGVYVIGEAIPEGNYDLKWVRGSGSVSKYVDNTTTLGASNLFQWVGNINDYEQRVLINVVCKPGEYLHIDGNLIVEIRKSKPVVLDL